MSATKKEGSKKGIHKFQNKDLPFKVTKMPDELLFYAPPPTTNINYHVNLTVEKKEEYLVGKSNVVKLECEIKGLKNKELLKDLKVETKLLVDEGNVTASISPASITGFENIGEGMKAFQSFKLKVVQCEENQKSQQEVKNRREHKVHLQTSIINVNTKEVYYTFATLPFRTVERLTDEQKGKEINKRTKNESYKSPNKERKIRASSSPYSKVECEFKVDPFSVQSEKVSLEKTGAVMNLVKLNSQQIDKVDAVVSDFSKSGVQPNEDSALFHIDSPLNSSNEMNAEDSQFNVDEYLNF